MNPTVVIDNGSCYCRVGVGGEDAPRGVFQNAIAKFKGDTRVLVGREIDESRVINRMLLKRPFDRGYIVNWNLQHSIWSRMLDRYIPEVNLSDASLIMTEPILNLASIQTTTQEVIFEHFGFNEMHAAPAPELVMHAMANERPNDPVAQSLSGVVIDSGYSFTHAVPIFDGRAIKDAARRIRVGGRLLTNLMKEWVSYRSMNLKDEPYLVEQIKDQVCYVAHSVEDEMKRAFPKPRSQVSLEFVLPDGVHNERGFVQDPRDPAVIEAKRERAVGSAIPPLLQVNCERFMVPEALLRPGDVGLPQVGIMEVASQALNASHAALRPLLSSNFVLAGGCAACPGMQPRIRRDLRPLVDSFYDLNVSVPENPASCAWRGGSAVAMNGWYKGIMVTRAAFEECGAGKMRRASTIA